MKELIEALITSLQQIIQTEPFSFVMGFCVLIMAIIIFLRFFIK